MNDFEYYDQQAKRYFQNSDYKSARQAFEQALSVARASGINNTLQFAQLLNNLGFTCQSQGDLNEALEFFQQAISLHRQISSSPNPDLATALHNLGRTLMMQKNNREAWGYLCEELDIWKQIINGPQHIPELASCLIALGDIMADRGEYENARTNFEQAAQFRETVLGASHPDTADAYAILGQLCAKQGDAKAARAYLNKALPIITPILGPDHYFVKRQNE